MLKKSFDILNIALFFIMISASGISLLFGVGTLSTEEFEKSEKRKRSRFPQNPSNWEMTKQYPTAFEGWFNDSFALRPQLSFAYNNSMYQLGISPKPNRLILGDEEWMFTKNYKLHGGFDVLRQHQGLDLFSTSELNAWIKSAQVKQKHLEKRGIKFIVAFPPKKHTIYAEMLPGYIRASDRTRTDQLLEALNETTITTLDLRPDLIDAKQLGQLYFKGDTHWNKMGAFISYSTIMDEVKKDFDTVNILNPEDVSFRELDSTIKGLAHRIGVGNVFQDINYIPEIKDPHKVTAFDIKDKPLPSTRKINTHIRITVAKTPSLKRAPKVMILRDSYTNFLYPYFNQSFSQSVYVPHGIYSAGTEPISRNLPALVNKYKPDIVILLVLDSFLALPLE